MTKEIKKQELPKEVVKEEIGILKPLEKEETLFQSYMEDFGLEGFCPFIKFKNFGDYIIGKFIKIDWKDIIKGIGECDNMYIEVTESNITTINETSKREGEIVESLVDMTVKFIIPTDVREKIKAHNLIEGRSIIGLKKSKLSEYGKFDNKMIEFEVFVKNE